MDVIITFVLAFAFSFIGMIPPGTLNLTIIQLGLENKIRIAWRFAIAACFVEYFYAWIAVEFADLITSSSDITDQLELITAIVMISLGALNLLASRKPTNVSRRFADSGIRKGIVLGILNPLAIPFWIAMTAYLKSRGWITLASTLELHVYLLGAFLGSVCLLIMLTYLAKSVVVFFQQSTFLKQIPGYVLLALGLYAFIRYLI